MARTCKSCRHFKLELFFRIFGLYHHAECVRPESMKVNPITGKKESRMCQVQRMSPLPFCPTGVCGIEGQYWEEK